MELTPQLKDSKDFDTEGSVEKFWANPLVRGVLVAAVVFIVLISLAKILGFV